MAAPITRYRSTNMVIIKCLNYQIHLLAHISESEYQIFHNIVSMFVNINNKKRKNEIKAIHVSYSAIMAAVCHMTSMTRRHGNNNAKQSKITVA